jgi:hypothetical protein
MERSINIMGSVNQSMVYLSLLDKSLKKKGSILDRLIELTQRQGNLISNDKIEDVQFNNIINDKDELIKLINELDNGFEQIYQRVKDVITADPDSFGTQIEELKELITAVTDKGIQLQVMERRNKDKIDAYLQTKRKSIKSFKVNSRTASSYYSSMNNIKTEEAYFFDKKK